MRTQDVQTASCIDHTNYTYIHTYRMYLFGEYKAEDQEEMLSDLDKRVTEVYTRCIGPNEANIP